jgi:phosphomannomutase
MSALFCSVSGVRGIVGDSLTPQVASDFGKAFGSLIKKGKIVIGQDTRESGDILKKSFIEGILSTGCNVIDLGILPTPTILFNIKSIKAEGGVIITASHNPKEWNGIKFANNEGIFLNVSKVRELLDIYKNKDWIKVSSNNFGTLNTDNRGGERHIEGIIKTLDVELIRSKQFKVVLDAGGGTTSVVGPSLLEALRCKVVKLFCAPVGDFPRPPEPTSENLSELKRYVIKERADIGFATDPDGDRLSIVSEEGEALGEEYTFPLVASHELEAKKGIVVTNLSTSRMIEDVAHGKGAKVVRTKVGEANVVGCMLHNKAVLGGEGNGGVIVPEIQYTRDSLTGMGKILEYMATSGKKVSELKSQIPSYHMIKRKIVWDKDIPYEKLLSKLPKGETNYEDGIRISFDEGWVHVRKSNTEPVLRAICEAKDKPVCETLWRTVAQCLE